MSASVFKTFAQVNPPSVVLNIPRSPPGPQRLPREATYVLFLVGMKIIIDLATLGLSAITGDKPDKNINALRGKIE